MIIFILGISLTINCFLSIALFVFYKDYKMRSLLDKTKKSNEDFWGF